MAISGTQTGTLVETIKGFLLGLNDYADPETMLPNAWATSSNVYSGQHGMLVRARKAYTVYAGAAATISTIARATNVITATTSAPHGFLVGMRVVVTGVTDSGFNGTFILLSASGFTLTWAQTAGNASSSGGTATPNYADTSRFTGLVPFKDPSQHIVVGYTANNKIWAFNSASRYDATQRVHPFYASGASAMGGTWSQVPLFNMLWEMNGTVKMRGRDALLQTIENWGIDASDTAPTLSHTAALTIDTAGNSGALRASGVSTIKTTASHGLQTGAWVTIAGCSDATFDGTFEITVTSSTQFTYSQPTGADVGAATAGSGSVGSFTATVGRYFSFAWWNDDIADLSAPCPDSVLDVPVSQYTTVQCIQAGTVAVNGTATVTGTGTSFSSAWIGRRLWSETNGDLGYISAVGSATSLTLSVAAANTNSGKKFQVFDPQSTHVIAYATGDGGAVFFRWQRNVFDPTQTTLILAGLQFQIGASTDPPDDPFTTEDAQYFNVPPPLGRYLIEYQTRMVVFGVDATPQTFYYSNIEFTVYGFPISCFAPLNQITLPIGDASIKGAGVLPTGLILWSDKHDMFKLTGLLSDNDITGDIQLGSSIQRLPFDMGCGSPWATVKTPLGLFWLTSDREVRLFNDQYAPRNVGRSIQTALNSITDARLPYAKMATYRFGEKNWLVLSVATGASAFNNKAYILDLDLLQASGEASTYLFDMISSQPVWYEFATDADGICASWDSGSHMHLLSGGSGQITEEDYDGSSFLLDSAEKAITAATTLHAWGNKDPERIKDVRQVRFTTNRSPAQMVTDGWSFTGYGVDDDVYTFDSSLSLVMTPGTNSVGKTSGIVSRAWEYSTSLFKMGSVNFLRGRRIQFKITFPTAAGDFRFRGIQLIAKAFKPR